MVSLNKIGLKLDGGSWPDSFGRIACQFLIFFTAKAHLLVFMFDMLILFG